MMSHLKLVACFLAISLSREVLCTQENNCQDPKDGQPAATPETRILDAYFDALNRYYDNGTPRKEFVTELDVLLKIEAKANETKFVREMKTLVERMIKEDEEAARTSKPDLAQESRDDSIKRLIFELRDHGLVSKANPANKQQKRADVQEQLVRFGYDAFPLLLESIEDDRLTRTTRVFGAYAYRYRVGDCCREVLESITGNSFWHGGEMDRDRRKAVREAAQRWFNEYQQLGEKQLLIKAIEKNDSPILNLAKRLVAKFPDDAIRELPRIIKKFDKYGRIHLVYAISELNDPLVVAFMKDEIKGPSLTSRVAASRYLAERGHKEGVAALIDDWNRLEIKSRGDGFDESAGISNLTFDLVRFASKETIDSLRVGISKKPIYLRHEVLKAISHYERSDDWKRPTSIDIEKAVDELLLSALDDKGREANAENWMSINGKMTRVSIRTCDLASMILTVRWRQPELFDITNSDQPRDKQIAEIKKLAKSKSK